MWPFGDGKPAASSATSIVETNNASIQAAPLSRADIRAAKGQQADHEFAEFIRSLDTSAPPEKTAVAPTPAIGGIVPSVTTAVTPPKLDYEPQTYEDGTVDIRPEVMHPRSMNCRQQFDQAFYCQSLGGKFNDIYRYGQFRSCSEQWSAFWFCMRVRTLGDDTKAVQTVEYYRDRDEKKLKQHGSSEDVWDIRTRSVQRAFWKVPFEDASEEAVKE